MRKIIVLSFITLDGVMQAPGGPEDTSGGFKYGGWSAPYFYEADEAAGEFVAKHMKSADLLLGRKTGMAQVRLTKHPRVSLCHNWRLTVQFDPEELDGRKTR